MSEKKVIKDMVDDLFSMKADADECWAHYEKLIDLGEDTGAMYSENVLKGKEVQDFKKVIIKRIKKI